ncbi:MAG TPA: cyclic nucleotide-binding domain-containing protein [Bacteroidales bacterium]|nr:cyclic nucleotide-binding domain-containing protein [Bacteroidales bacterium]
MQQLIDFINRYTDLDTESIQALKRNVEFETFSRNQFILNEGRTCNKVWFIKSGMVRKFHLFNGKEITTWIHLENEMFTSLGSYINSIPATEYFQACENTALISITKENSLKLSAFPQLAQFSNNLLGDQLAKIDIMSAKFKTMTAAEKYKLLLSLSPELFKRAKLGYLASVMGITQETLSRIRKQV